MPTITSRKIDNSEISPHSPEEKRKPDFFPDDGNGKRIVIHFREMLKKRVSGLDSLTIPAGICLLIGPNGSGKSTVSGCILGKYSEKNKLTPKEKTASLELFGIKNVKIGHFDFEKSNPRIQPTIENYHQVVAMFSSHGETNRAIVNSMPNTEHLLLDEPEQALDFEGLEILKGKILERKDKPELLTIVITHSPILICDNRFNVVELVPGYREKIKQSVRDLSRQL